MSIESELLAIKGDDDLLKPEDVVEWARNHKDSDLHKAPQFCGWDLKRSAYQHWLQAARNLIALHLTFEGGQRQYISLSIDRVRDGGGYRDVNDILRDRTLHAVMLEDALRDLERIKTKYEFLSQLKPLWQEVAKIRKRGKKGRERTEHRLSP